MTTIYLGGNFVAYEDPRSSHLSKQAREVVDFEPFEPKNQREIRAVPVLTMFAAVSIGLLALALLLARAAAAHDVWANGSPVPGWVKDACCGPDEAHQLRRDQVHKVAGGYKIDGYPLTIPDTSALPSQDENFWAFYKIYGIVDNKTQVSNVRCFFVPFGV